MEFLIPIAVVVGLGLIALMWFIGTYNGFVRRRNGVDNTWAQIDVQLKRRHDLVPNLVETVRGYAGHEKETLEKVIAARNVAAGARGVAEVAQAETALTGMLGRLMAVAEAYPDLKANKNFLALQEELTSTENKIGFARQAYNDSVMEYNSAIESIPANIVASFGGFKPKESYHIEDAAEREAPKVKF